MVGINEMTERQITILCAVGLARFLGGTIFETREQLFSVVEEKIATMREGAKNGEDVKQIFIDDPALESICNHLH